MADTINKADLVAAIAADSGQSQATVSTVVDSLFAVLASSLKDGKKVSIPGWMSVEPTQRAARMGRNPATGESIHIAASTGVRPDAEGAVGSQAQAVRRATSQAKERVVLGHRRSKRSPEHEVRQGRVEIRGPASEGSEVVAEKIDRAARRVVCEITRPACREIEGVRSAGRPRRWQNDSCNLIGSAGEGKGPTMSPDAAADSTCRSCRGEQRP